MRILKPVHFEDLPFFRRYVASGKEGREENSERIALVKITNDVTVEQTCMKLWVEFIFLFLPPLSSASALCWSIMLIHCTLEHFLPQFMDYYLFFFRFLDISEMTIIFIMRVFIKLLFLIIFIRNREKVWESPFMFLTFRKWPCDSTSCSELKLPN